MAAVSCVLYIESYRRFAVTELVVDYIISSSWDKTVKVWDARVDAPQPLLFELKQISKVYSMNISSDM